MKPILFILFLLATVAATAQTNVGSLGDVKYSILDPDKFIEKNGNGWVLMMGQNIEGSDLHSFTGMNKLPDVRGNFIRSMNLNREINGDPDLNRLVGSYQNDTIKSHRHNIHDYKSNVQINDSKVGPWDGSSFREEEEETTYFGGQETRPKNIALYTYIKINE